MNASAPHAAPVRFTPFYAQAGEYRDLLYRLAPQGRCRTITHRLGAWGLRFDLVGGLSLVIDARSLTNTATVIVRWGERELAQDTVPMTSLDDVLRARTAPPRH